MFYYTAVEFIRTHAGTDSRALPHTILMGLWRFSFPLPPDLRERSEHILALASVWQPCEEAGPRGQVSNRQSPHRARNRPGQALGWAGAARRRRLTPSQSSSASVPPRPWGSEGETFSSDTGCSSVSCRATATTLHCKLERKGKRWCFFAFSCWTLGQGDDLNPCICSFLLWNFCRGNNQQVL